VGFEFSMVPQRVQGWTLGPCLPAQSSIQLSLLGWKLDSTVGGV
jgi:hypothetical protein